MMSAVTVRLLKRAKLQSNHHHQYTNTSGASRGQSGHALHPVSQWDLPLRDGKASAVKREGGLRGEGEERGRKKEAQEEGEG